MNVDRAVLALAGTLVLLSTLLTVVFSPWWLLLTTFVGLNLLQSSVTGFCPAAMILSKLGLSPGCAFDPNAAARTPSRLGSDGPSHQGDQI